MRLTRSPKRATARGSRRAILATRAVALEKQGRSVAGLASLEQAVEYARISGCVRCFVDLGTAMQTLLLRLAGRGFARETVRRILAAFPQVPSKVEPAGGTRLRAANADLVEPLTDRELDVLVIAARTSEQQGDRPTAGPLRHDRQASLQQYLQQARRRRAKGCRGEGRRPQDSAFSVDPAPPVKHDRQ